MRLAILILMLLAVHVSAAAASELANAIFSKVEPVACGIFLAIGMVAGGIASVIIIYGGIKYLAGADDPGARKQAKDMIIHAIVGMIIIIIAVELVQLGSGNSLTACAMW